MVQRPGSILQVSWFSGAFHPFPLLPLYKDKSRVRIRQSQGAKGNISTMSTLTTAISLPHLLIPPHDLTLTYSSLYKLIHSFQYSLAPIDVSPGNAVSISLANTLEFIVAFLAVGTQRAVAAPLNPNYKQEDFEFYTNDLKSKLVIVPVAEGTPAIRAARKIGTGIAEVKWDGHGDVALELKEEGDKLGGNEVKATAPTEDDVALVLHTSGTTRRPKAVIHFLTFILPYNSADKPGCLGTLDLQELTTTMG